MANRLVLSGLLDYLELHLPNVRRHLTRALKVVQDALPDESPELALNRDALKIAIGITSEVKSAPDILGGLRE
ncbi:hypothetical protein Bpla01_29710 [Burkholderia plantarii]|nr:hypothetical protein Bpla01_29710 [Burkholderia plantarii]